MRGAIEEENSGYTSSEFRFTKKEVKQVGCWGKVSWVGWVTGFKGRSRLECVLGRGNDGWTKSPEIKVGGLTEDELNQEASNFVKEYSNAIL